MTLERESKRFAGNVGVCWHEPDNVAQGIVPLKVALQRFSFSATKIVKCKHGCGLEWDNAARIGGNGTWTLERAFRNPTYTIELIVAELKRIGKWDGFVEWHTDICRNVLFMSMKHKQLSQLTPTINAALCEILTTPLYLLQAASAYIEEVG